MPCERQLNAKGNADMLAEFVSGLNHAPSSLDVGEETCDENSYLQENHHYVETKGEMILLTHRFPLLWHTTQLRRR